MDPAPLSTYIKDYWWVIVSILGLVSLFTAFNPLFQSQENDQVIITRSQQNSDQMVERLLAVDVAGAVNQPGVYQLAYGQRIADALSAAGGVSPDADSQWLAKHINQAQKLTDGMKIYIPLQGDAVIGSESVLGTNIDTNFISINQATQAQLESLPGIGPVTATKIIDNRPYSAIEELRDSKIISQKVYLQNQASLVL